MLRILQKRDRYTTKEIAFLVQVSERLTRDYQALYRKYKGDQAYKDRLDEILVLNSVDHEPCKRGGDKLSMNTRQSIYAPLLDKTFETAVSSFISAGSTEGDSKECYCKNAT